MNKNAQKMLYLENKATNKILLATKYWETKISNNWPSYINEHQSKSAKLNNISTIRVCLFGPLKFEWDNDSDFRGVIKCLLFKNSEFNPLFASNDSEVWTFEYEI